MFYEDHIKISLKQVSNGLNLQFIDPYFRTKEVCLAAVKINKEELQNVPMGNLDYVTKELGIDLGSDIVKMMIARELEPRYYGEFNSYQEKLKFYKVMDHDQMIRKMYEMNRA